jgi:predicted ATPase
VLANSRQSLALAREADWRVPSLSVPGVQVFGRSRVQDPTDPTDPFDRSEPERLNARTPERLLEFEAVRLFVERGRAAARSFALTPQNAAAVVAVCRRLDGLPLAIELAAARLKALPVEHLVTRLDDRFRLLTGGSCTAPTRQQTLRAAIDWSCDLLSEPERALLRALAVFPASFTLEAAEAVISGWWFVESPASTGTPGAALFSVPEPSTNHQPPSTAFLDQLAQLVDKSLVMAETPGGETRYRLLETVREYAREQLSGEEQHLFQWRHAEYFCSLPGRVDPRSPAAEIVASLDQLEREHDHLRAAVDWAVSQGETALAWRLGAALGGFWQVRGYWREGRKRLADILSLAFSDPGGSLAPAHVLVERAHSLDRAADLALMQNDDGAARELYEQSQALYHHLGDEAGAAYARTQLGNLARRREEFATARALLRESLSFYEARADRASVAWGLSCLGEVAENEQDHLAAAAFYRQSLAVWRERDHRPSVVHGLICLGRVTYLDGDSAAAKSLFTECLTIARELHYESGAAFALYVLGSLARLDHDYARAVTSHREALALYRELGDDPSIAGSLAAVAAALHAQGEPGQAAALFKEALQLNRRLGNRRQIAHCLEGLAGVALSIGSWRLGVGLESSDPTPNPLTAAGLFGAAAALRERDSRRWPADQADYERNLAALQSRLQPAALAAAWDAGAAMAIEEVIALARTVEPRVETVGVNWGGGPH